MAQIAALIAGVWQEFNLRHPNYLVLRRLQPLPMIVLKISNSSEVVASKVGKFLEALTPDKVDQAAVEDQVIKKLVENLAAEGIKGEIASVNGVDIEGSELSLHDGLKVRKHTSF
tara:strand:- start:217 stop:561 length:345 start_codon:yes stop_codon:yes gene_type:complete